MEAISSPAAERGYRGTPRDPPPQRCVELPPVGDRYNGPGFFLCLGTTPSALACCDSLNSHRSLHSTVLVAYVTDEETEGARLSDLSQATQRQDPPWLSVTAPGPSLSLKACNPHCLPDGRAWAKQTPLSPFLQSHLRFTASSTDLALAGRG